MCKVVGVEFVMYVERHARLEAFMGYLFDESHHISYRKLVQELIEVETKTSKYLLCYSTVNYSKHIRTESSVCSLCHCGSVGSLCSQRLVTKR